MALENEIQKILDIGFAEDIGAGDVTCNAVIPADVVGKYIFRTREEITFCGADILSAAFTKIKITAKDSDVLKAGATIAEIDGNVREILAKERVVLNLLQHLCGIATETAKYVAAVSGTKAKILDTRKTLPGLRALEKYAVKCGGGQNHRMGLYDMVMIKDNHIRAAGGITAAVAKAKKYTLAHPALDAGSHAETPDRVRGVRMLVEVECDSLEQVREALSAGADIIMADNMDIPQLQEVVKLVNGKVPVEASGNVSLETVRQIAEAGVDFISTSKITMSARAVDIGLDEA